MIGAGHQSAFQIRAAARAHAFERVIGWNPHPEMLRRLADTAAELGLPFQAVDLPTLGAEADVIIDHLVAGRCFWTSMSRARPISRPWAPTRAANRNSTRRWSPAPAFSPMRSRNRSASANTSTPSPGPDRRGGDQRTGRSGDGRGSGRNGAEVTIFDGTGVGLQDLAVAAAVVELAKSKGVAQGSDLPRARTRPIRGG